MKQIIKNQLGIALLTELLLVGLVLSAGGAVAVRSYYANKAPKYEDVGTSAHKDKDAKTTSPATTANTPPTKKPTPPPTAAPKGSPKMLTFTTPVEKISFSYPEDWTLSGPYGQGEAVWEYLHLSHPSGFTVGIQVNKNSYLNSANNAENSKWTKLSLVDSFVLNGKTVYIMSRPDFYNTGIDRMVLSACNEQKQCFVDAKNTDGKLIAELAFKDPAVKRDNKPYNPDPFNANDPNAAVGKQIIKSLHY